MSKVSLKNELLPSFEPIEQKGTAQKRKRTAAALKDASSRGGDDGQPATKKSKAKKQSAAAATTVTLPATITKTIACWIGASLMQNNKNEEEEETTTAAFSIYYGPNDTRNCTEKITIQKSQTVDHVYTMGVIRALETCQDESSALDIYTGSLFLQAVIDQDDIEETHRIIKEHIAKRKGSTSIRYKIVSSAVVNKEKDENQIAHIMATEKLSEAEDKVMIDDEEETLVDSLEVTATTTTTTTTVIKIKTEDNDVKEEETIATTIEKEEIIEPLLPPTPPTWAQTLNLRNLLDILKAPFNRKQK